MENSKNSIDDNQRALIDSIPKRTRRISLTESLLIRYSTATLGRIVYLSTVQRVTTLAYQGLSPIDSPREGCLANTRYGG